MNIWEIVLLGMVGAFLLIMLWLCFRLNQEKSYRSAYPSGYLCGDGHKVRSISEWMIDEVLQEMGVEHKYEDVILKSKGNYKYDFYLPHQDIYIEFFGYSGRQYHQTRAVKEKLYRSQNLHLLAIEPKDLVDLRSFLANHIDSESGSKTSKKSDTTVRHCPHCGESLDDRM